VDIARGEQVEHELEAFIRHRDRQRRQSEGQRPEEEMYAESVRRYNERERRQRAWEKLRHHESMIRSHTANFEAIVGRHHLEVARCEELFGIGGLSPLGGKYQENGHENGHHDKGDAA
jgi:hypothetical protein